MSPRWEQGAWSGTANSLPTHGTTDTLVQLRPGGEDGPFPLITAIPVEDGTAGRARWLSGGSGRPLMPGRLSPSALQPAGSCG